jgi:hypothetical protein
MAKVPLPPPTDPGAVVATCSQGAAAAMCHIFLKGKGSLSPDEGAGFLEPLVAREEMRASADSRLPIDDPMLLEAAIALPQRHTKAMLRCMAMAQPFKDSRDPLVDHLDACVDRCDTAAFTYPSLLDCMGNAPGGSTLLVGHV